jgi:hypothetical protein
LTLAINLLISLPLLFFEFVFFVMAISHIMPYRMAANSALYRYQVRPTPENLALWLEEREGMRTTVETTRIFGYSGLIANAALILWVLDRRRPIPAKRQPVRPHVSD